uniref:Uncharacterized protein n=1 Tax=Globodera pallida TaxID=36090 RepID=A0A183BI31_GLOPA
MSNHLTKPILTFLLVLIVANVNGQYGYQYNQLYLQQQQQQSLQLCQQQVQNLQQQIFSLMQNQKEQAGSVPSANSNNTRGADATDSEKNLLDVAVVKKSSPNFVKSAFT